MVLHELELSESSQPSFGLSSRKVTPLCDLHRRLSSILRELFEDVLAEVLVWVVLASLFTYGKETAINILDDETA